MRELYLRRAELTDIDLLYEWTNDPVVRTNSFNSENISYNDHQKWFASMMADENIIQYILMADSTPVGQIRITIEGNTAEIGYSISERYRQKGYGQKILNLLQKEVERDFSHIDMLIAKVKPENIASNKLFKREDYEMKYIYFSKKIGGVSD